MIVPIIDGTLLCIAGGLMLYLLGLSLLAMVASRGRPVVPAVAHRFAVVIPAHNEEMSVARTIRSIRDVDYPDDRFECIVIADNCTDQTAAIARQEGATVMERYDPVRKSKGYALRWCFDQILGDASKYDAVIVVDADSLVTENFLSVMSGYLQRGVSVIQSNDMVEPQPGVWSVEIIRFGFTLYNHVRPLGRKLVSLSAGLRGNGMCFSANVLREIPWCTYGLNEDLEYGLILLLGGIRSEFAREATVLATMPANPKNAESQRERWEKGRYVVVREYAPRLLKQFLLHGSIRSLDALIDLIMPPFVNLFGLVIGFTLLNLAGALLEIKAASTLLPYWLCAVTAGFLHVLVGLLAAKADKGLYKALFSIPRYVFWKIIIYARMLIRGTTGEWIRTTREKSIKP